MFFLSRKFVLAVLAFTTAAIAHFAADLPAEVLLAILGMAAAVSAKVAAEDGGKNIGGAPSIGGVASLLAILRWLALDKTFQRSLFYLLCVLLMHYTNWPAELIYPIVGMFMVALLGDGYEAATRGLRRP